MTVGQMIFTIGLPALIGAIIIVPAWVIPTIRRLSGVSGSALGVALGLALVIAFMAEASAPSLPPAQKWHMLPIITCGIVLLCPVVAILDGSGELGRWLISIAVGAIIGWLAVFPGMDVLGRCLLGIWVGSSFMVLSWVSHRRRGITVNLSATIVFIALVILCKESHFITLTLIALALSVTAAIGFACALVAEVWTRDKHEAHRSIAIGWGGAFALASIIPMVAFCGWAYSYGGEVQWLHWALVGGAPLMLGLGELPAFQNWKGGGGFFMRIGLVGMPIALAFVFLFTGVGIGGDTPSDESNIEYLEHEYGQ